MGRTEFAAFCFFIAAILCSAVSFGQDAAPAILKDSYVGRDPDAAWRTAAAERIKKYRKGDLNVVVRDRAGEPVEGARVSVRMKRHAFWFGSRVDVNLINSDTDDAQKYRQSFLELFNYATVNTVYYFQWRTPRGGKQILDATLQAIPWLQRHGYPMRGHTLVWWFKDENIEKPTQQVYERVIEHINQTAGNRSLAAAFDEWDVQNEPFSNSDIFKKLGREKLVDFFELVHKHDPDAKLFLNECHLISQLHQKDRRQRRDFIYALVKELIDKDVPIHGLGFQSHHVGTLAPIPDILPILDRFAGLGVDMQVTEYDIKLRPAANAKDWTRRWRAPVPTTPELERLEGEYMRDFLTVIFSHPGMKAFIMWGFWDGRHWLNNGPIFRKDWSLKPSGAAYKDLVLNKWWTNEDGKTNNDGILTTRGFLGEYEVTVEHKGKEKTVKAALSRRGETVSIEL
jgi:endo-1,4-beta-xylanase